MGCRAPCIPRFVGDGPKSQLCYEIHLLKGTEDGRNLGAWRQQDGSIRVHEGTLTVNTTPNTRCVYPPMVGGAARKSER
jgi:hypothetical protein